MLNSAAGAVFSGDACAGAGLAPGASLREPRRVSHDSRRLCKNDEGQAGSSQGRAREALGCEGGARMLSEVRGA